MRRGLVLAAVLAMVAAGGAAMAAEVEVKMLNKGTEGMMVFEPALVSIQPGDTVKFVAADKGHNVEAIDGMVPEGAVPFVGKINEEVVVAFDKPGVYGIKCKPHYAMGMVGMIVVGKPGNEETAQKIVHPGKAKQVFAALFGRAASSIAAAK